MKKVFIIALIAISGLQTPLWCMESQGKPCSKDQLKKITIVSDDKKKALASGFVLCKNFIKQYLPTYNAVPCIFKSEADDTYEVPLLREQLKGSDYFKTLFASDFAEQYEYTFTKDVTPLTCTIITNYFKCYGTSKQEPFEKMLLKFLKDDTCSEQALDLWYEADKLQIVPLMNLFKKNIPVGDLYDFSCPHEIVIKDEKLCDPSTSARIVWSPSKKYFAKFNKYTVELYDAQTQNIVNVFQEKSYSKYYSKLVFDKDDFLAIGTGRICDIYDVITGKKVKTITMKDTINSLFFYDNSLIIDSGDGHGQYIDLYDTKDWDHKKTVDIHELMGVEDFIGHNNNSIGFNIWFAGYNAAVVRDYSQQNCEHTHRDLLGDLHRKIMFLDLKQDSSFDINVGPDKKKIGYNLTKCVELDSQNKYCAVVFGDWDSTYSKIFVYDLLKKELYKSIDMSFVDKIFEGKGKISSLQWIDATSLLIKCIRFLAYIDRRDNKHKNLDILYDFESNQYKVIASYESKSCLVRNSDFVSDKGFSIMCNNVLKTFVPLDDAVEKYYLNKIDLKEKEEMDKKLLKALVFMNPNIKK